jgi:CheY-like chemotaxis protein
MPHKILALKDRPEYALELKQLIEPHGYKVLAVSTIEEALARLHVETVNMVIVAIHLQDGNVFDFIRAVKTDPDPLISKLPLICLNLNQRLHAKYLNEGLEISAMVLGANRFITMEPYDAKALWLQIMEMLPPDPSIDPSTVGILSSP